MQRKGKERKVNAMNRASNKFFRAQAGIYSCGAREALLLFAYKDLSFEDSRKQKLPEFPENPRKRDL
jgi:hypothetical protein